MVIALAIILLLVALAIVVFGVAIIFTPDDEISVLESRSRTNPTRWVQRPLRTDSRRLAAPAFADRWPAR